MAEAAATTRMRPHERREQILLAARGVFAEEGYEGASVDELASRAGITKPIVYRHFRSKRGLYHAVLEDHMNDLIRRLWVALSSSPDPRERLRGGLRAYLDFV